MTTERIDIIIREDGSRVVRRNIEDIGVSANKTDSALSFMKRTLGGIAFGLVARETLQLIDSYTALQNKLRGVGLEGSALTQVYSELLGVANLTRSSLEGTATIYSRLALNSKELGASQRELIDFTKTLNQAIVLSGATTQEANGALIQFSQGMASGTLRGDELRSVLEQLPIVADVIARQLGITRGELREFGKEGKITSQVILEAFKNAAPALERAFASTIPTMSQAFQVLKNNFVDFLGRADAALGLSTAISKALLFLANNIDFLADALKRVTIALITAGAAYVTMLASIRVSVWLEATAASIAYARAVSAGTVVTLGSAAAQQAQAAHAASAAAAQTAASTAIVAAQTSAAAATLQSAATSATAQALQTTAARVAIETTRQTTIAKLAATQVERASLLATIAASEAAGAQSFALATKRTALLQLTQVEATHATLLNQLAALDARRVVAVQAQTAALAGQTAAQNALNVAQGRAAAAQGAAVAASAAASSAAASAAAAGTVAGTSVIAQAFSKLRDVFASVFGFVSRFFVLINSNPFTVLAVGLITVTGLLLGFGDQIDAGIDGITNMQDVLRALAAYASDAFDVVKEAVSSIFDGIAELANDSLSAITGYTSEEISKWISSYSDFYADVGTGFAGVVRAVAKTFDAIGGLIIGMALGIGRAIAGLPAIFQEVFNRVYNVVVGTVENMLNMIIEGVNKIRTFIGASPIELIKFTKQEVEADAFKKYGENISKSIDDGFNAQGGALVGSVNSFFDRASEISIERAKKAFRDSEKASQQVDLTVKGTPAKIKTDDDVKGLNRMQNALRSLLNTIIPSEGAFLELEKAAKTLDDAVAHLGLSQEESNRYFQIAVDHYFDMIQPLGKLNREMDEQTKLLGFSNREREIESQLLEITRDFKRQGIPLDKEEVRVLKEKLTTFQQLNAVVQAQDNIIEASVGKRKEFVTQLIAIQNLLANPPEGFKPSDVVSAFPEQFEGTNEAFKKQIDDTRAFYAEIDQLRANDLISEESAKLRKDNKSQELFSGNLLGGTKQSIDLQLNAYTEMMSKIKSLRDANFIDEQTKNQLTLQAQTEMGQKLIQLNLQAAQVRLELGTGSWADAQIVSLGRLTQGYTTFIEGTSSAMGDFFTTLTDGFADSVGRSIVYADSLGEALSNVASQALASLISALVKLGIQWLVNAALGQSIAATSAASSLAITAGTATATASMWAPAAALASLATLGANAAPAAAGIISTVALSEGLAVLGAFKSGGYTGNGPIDAVAGFVHGKEFVVNASATEEYRGLLERLNVGMSPIPSDVPGGNVPSARFAPAPAMMQQAAPAAAQSGNPQQNKMSIKVVNVLDKQLFEDYLNTEEGQQTIVNVMRRNGDASRVA